MVPIETYMLTLWLIFAIVGIVRRFPLELGATIGFVAMLFFFHLAGGLLQTVATKVNSILAFSTDLNLVYLVTYTSVIIAIVTMVYAGETFVYAGTWPPSPLSGRAIDLVIALFNGWLVVGTWWYYMDLFNYPQSLFGQYQAPLSNMALRLVALTPFAVIPAEHRTWILGMALLGLLFLKVRR
ncbi:MAG: hypothetical protein IPJ58_06070 [Ardenticatenia bacterium]|nr:hypothetical protein [Ardenticatenia bacterium]